MNNGTLLCRYHLLGRHCCTFTYSRLIDCAFVAGRTTGTRSRMRRVLHHTLRTAHARHSACLFTMCGICASVLLYALANVMLPRICRASFAAHAHAAAKRGGKGLRACWARITRAPAAITLCRVTVRARCRHICVRRRAASREGRSHAHVHIVAGPAVFAFGCPQYRARAAARALRLCSCAPSMTASNARACAAVPRAHAANTHGTTGSGPAHRASTHACLHHTHAFCTAQLHAHTVVRAHTRA